MAEARPPLGRERILQTALALADEHGLESVSMRKLGQALGYEAMSLYNYLSNKDDLLEGMLDLVLAEIEPPSVGGDWRQAVRKSAISVHQALSRHPWAIQLLVAPSHIRPARLEYMNALLGCLRQAGFTAATTYHAYHVLDAHMIGFSLWTQTHSSTPSPDTTDMREWLERMVPAERLPHLHEHVLQHLSDGPHREPHPFELGLDLLLDGLEPLRQPSATV